jgi:uncharacterized membrane protein HdeD (DUF308 family)
MSTFAAGSRSPRLGSSTPPTWARVLIGVVLVLAGLLVLGDVALATTVSTIFIGLIAIGVGAFEIGHVVWTKGWGGYVWQAGLGLIYIGLGIVLVSQPASGAVILTYVIGLLFLLSGVFRILFSISHWNEVGLIMFLAGLVGVLAGFFILMGLPKTGVWVLGLILGFDLISHGVAWLRYGWISGAAA